MQHVALLNCPCRVDFTTLPCVLESEELECRRFVQPPGAINSARYEIQSRVSYPRMVPAWRALFPSEFERHIEHEAPLAGYPFAGIRNWSNVRDHGRDDVVIVVRCIEKIELVIVGQESFHSFVSTEKSAPGKECTCRGSLPLVLLYAAMRSCNAAELAAAATVGNKDTATSLRRCRCRNSWRYGRRNVVQTKSPILTLLYRDPKSQNIDAPVNYSSRCAGPETCEDSSRCTQPTSTTVMMHVPNLRPDQRTEVPELAAAATVGTQDAATSSQRFHVPSRIGLQSACLESLQR